LARQAVATPGNFYPEERFLRLHMAKSGMESLASSVTDFSTAFALTAQVQNTVMVPMGEGQYGTDSGDSSGEGDADHTVFAIIRDHASPSIYYRDSFNPTFRRVRLADLNTNIGATPKKILIESGANFVDMTQSMI